jgi:hypothetical protein
VNSVEGNFERNINLKYMKQFNVLLLAMLCLTLTASAQTDEFKPGGKPFMKIYSNYHTTFSDGGSASAFELTRVYLGYEYAFSKNFSAKANIDVGDPGAGGLQMTAYVKNAYLKYQVNHLTVNFGLISTTQFKVQENFWGYRYLEKSFQDEYKFNSSADLGVSVAYKFSDFLAADFIIANGEGYKKLESDSTLRTGFGATFTPVKKFVGRAYYDFSSKDHTQSSLATFIGFVTDNFSLGAEYNRQLNVRFNDGHDWNGASFYTTIKTSQKVKLFARYDKLFSDTLSGETNGWNHSKDGQAFIAGLEFAPVKGVKLAPNFKGWSPDDESKPFISSLFLNCEFKF